MSSMHVSKSIVAGGPAASRAFAGTSTWERRSFAASATRREKPYRPQAPLQHSTSQDDARTDLGQGKPEMERQHSKLAVLNMYNALVLDLSYKPIDIVNWQRAICLDMFEKVDVLEYYDIEVSSARDLFPLPAVVRVRMYLKLTALDQKVHLSRKNILIRDKHTCQYCGKGGGRDLSVDHIKPISRGGKWTWENLVTACKPCNQKKGDKTLAQIGWKLLHPPKEPSPSELGGAYTMGFGPVSNPPKEWSFYIQPLTSQGTELSPQLSGDGIAPMTPLASGMDAFAGKEL